MTIKCEKEANNILRVTYPFNKRAHERLVRFGRPVWSGVNGGTWTFNAAFEKEIREVLIEVFGTDGTIGVELATVKVTFTKKVSATQTSVRYAGKVFADAYSKNSGATTGPDVELVAGTIGSAGSAKNWVSVVYAGAKFIVKNVYPKLIPELTEAAKDGVVYEILGPPSVIEAYNAIKPEPIAEPEPEVYWDEKSLASIDDETLCAELLRRGFKVYRDCLNTSQDPSFGTF